MEARNEFCRGRWLSQDMEVWWIPLAEENQTDEVQRFNDSVCLLIDLITFNYYIHITSRSKMPPHARLGADKIGVLGIS